MSQFTSKLAEPNRARTDGTQDVYLPFALNEVTSSIASFCRKSTRRLEGRNALQFG